jgi:hypothetical protein
MGMIFDFFQHVASGLDISGLPGVNDPDPGSSHLQNILNIVFVLTGAVAVLTVVIAGFRMVISRGNPQQIAQARNAIIFAAIGLAVIIMAFTIVNFIVFRVT